jgi:hypothetical protein
VIFFYLLLTLAFALLLCSFRRFGFLELKRFDPRFLGGVVVAGVIAVEVGHGPRAIDILAQAVAVLSM